MVRLVIMSDSCLTFGIFFYNEVAKEKTAKNMEKKMRGKRSNFPKLHRNTGLVNVDT